MSTHTGRCGRVSTGQYEVDLDTGEVLRQGRRLPIQEQPFRVLALLLENPGQLVTREGLQARIWPADTHVSFDEGLNTAIRKLRVLFGDSAENPRYIETVPRRGYRFIAPVRELAEGERATQPGEADEAETRGRRAGIWALAAALMAIAVVGLAAGVAVYRARRHAAAVSALPSPRAKREKLVVLPFMNLSGDPAQDYFSDGLTEETITDLGQLSPDRLGVIARTSAMAYKHTDKTVSEIGRELGVDYVLEGSVRRESGRARISAQLIRVSDQTHLWAQNYDAENLKDILGVEDQIGRAIAEQVQTSVAPGRELSRARTTSPEAYDLYLRARFYWNQRTPESVKQSIALFKRSTEADPKFAEAYAGLADAYNISNIVGLYSPRKSFPEARTAALKAIALEPELAEAHAALGMEESHYEFDLPRAREEFLKAIALNPNSSYAHLFYSNCYLMPMGQRTEAIAENKIALELDPLSLPINNFLGENYVLAGDYRAAEAQFQRTIAMDPNFPLPHLYLAGLYEVEGRFAEAIAEREKGDVLSGLSETAARARAATLQAAVRQGGAAGYWAAHRGQDLQDMQRSGAGISANVLAADYAQEGKKDEAFVWLDKSYEAREGQELTLLAVDPVWRNLHGDARFADLLKRIGLPEGVGAAK
jgi:TolB-like protein/DNA-binding winged helix-turn-helix (wHTH) protein